MSYGGFRKEKTHPQARYNFFRTQLDHMFDMQKTRSKNIAWCSLTIVHKICFRLKIGKNRLKSATPPLGFPDREGWGCPEIKKNVEKSLTMSKNHFF